MIGWLDYWMIGLNSNQHRKESNMNFSFYNFTQPSINPLIQPSMEFNENNK